MENYKKMSVKNDPRTELHDALELTGAEISINNLPAGAGVPFVHSHKQNEEVYGILDGSGRAVIDGKEIPLTKGDWIRISPAAKRQFFAGKETPLSYVCIQTREHSLEGFTQTDAVIIK